MSQFLNQNDGYTSDYPAGIDFDNAVRLPGGGSTCDIFRTRWQRRDVFVKRLKEEHRDKPLYLDALDKEYDVGVGLHHPSLPEYRESHRDYIVMDFIDGTTLAHMIGRKDAWLSDERHVLSMLRQLVDVVDYLHRHNVVHCDIKPDNIMITANGKNLVLIDFDKSYTDALNDTSGHPSKYGMPVDEAGTVTIDFRGIAMVVERLRAGVPRFRFRRYRRFVRACRRRDVTCDELTVLLDYAPGSKPKLKTVMASVFALCVLSAASSFLYYNTREQENGEEQSRAASDSPAADTLSAVPVARGEVLPVKSTGVVRETEARSQGELHEDARNKAEIFDRRITHYFRELNAGLDRLCRLTGDSRLTGQQLLDSIRRHVDREDEYTTEAFEVLKETFPDITEREAWRIMSHSKVYTGYKRRAESELREYGLEIERRFHAEGGSLR